MEKPSKPFQINPKKIVYILLVFGLIFLLTMFIYGASVSGNYLFFTNPRKYISSQSDDWAAFGTLLSGLFTLLGSFSTVLTLIFLLIQNKENLDRVDQQLKQTQFDKFKLHKEMFYAHLKEIEQDDNGEFKFLSKQKLYGEIFPLNDFDACSTKINLNVKIDDEYPSLQSKMIKIIDARDKILEGINGKNYINDPFKLVNDIFKFNVMLGLIFIRPARAGDVIMYNKTIVLNAISIKHAVNLVDSITLRLMSFTHSGSLLHDLKKFNSTEFTFNLLNLCKKFEDEKMASAIFPLNMIQVNDNVYNAFKLHNSIKQFHENIMGLEETINYLEHFLDYFENLQGLESNDYYRLFLRNVNESMITEYLRMKFSPSYSLHNRVKFITLWAKCKIA